MKSVQSTLSLASSCCNFKLCRKTSTTFEHTKSNATLGNQAFRKRSMMNNMWFTGNKRTKTQLNALHKTALKQNLLISVNSPKSDNSSPLSSLNNYRTPSNDDSFNLPDYQRNYSNFNCPSYLSMDIASLYKTKSSHSLFDYLKESKCMTKAKYFLKAQRDSLSTFELNRAKAVAGCKSRASKSMRKDQLIPGQSLNELSEYTVYLKQTLQNEKSKEEALFNQRRQLDDDIRAMIAIIQQKNRLIQHGKAVRNLLICIKMHKFYSDDYFEKLMSPIRHIENNTPIKKKSYTSVFYQKNQFGKKKTPRRKEGKADSLPQAFSLSVEEKRTLDENKQIMRILMGDEKVFKSQGALYLKIKEMEEGNTDKIALLISINDDVNQYKVEKNKLEHMNDPRDEDIPIIENTEMECKQIKLTHIKLQSTLNNLRQFQNNSYAFSRTVYQGSNKINTTNFSLLRYQFILRQGRYQSPFAPVFVYLSTLALNLLKHFRLNNSEDIRYKANMLQLPDCYPYGVLCSLSMELLYIAEKAVNSLLKKQSLLTQTKGVKDILTDLEKKLQLQKKALNAVEQQKIINERKKEIFANIQCKHHKTILKKRKVCIDRHTTKKQIAKEQKKKSLSIDDAIFYAEEAIPPSGKDRRRQCKSL